MSEPKRYELYVDARLQAEEGGEWVKWDDYARLKAKVERLTKAGDDMAVWITIIGNSSTCWQTEEWLRAKKGLPSEKEQREKQIKAVKDSL